MSEPLTGYNAWAGISPADQAEFLNIVINIKQRQNSKNVSSAVFRSQIQMLINFIDRDAVSRSNKCMILGISFIGPYMCTNTKLLSAVMGRSKASINNSLKDLGYIAIKSESVRSSILNLTVPNVIGPQIKQWSVRATFNEEKMFKTTYSSPYMPILNESYFSVDKAPSKVQQQPQIPPPAPQYQPSPQIPPPDDYYYDYDELCQDWQ